MAYDERLADRVRAGLTGRSDISERKMFGGLAFMLSGNMCCCVSDRGLILRVGVDAYDDALALPHAGLMDFTGRPMRGWIMVEPDGLASDDDLAVWVSRATEFVATLAAKK